jgi:hypothetical protein
MLMHNCAAKESMCCSKNTSRLGTRPNATNCCGQHSKYVSYIVGTQQLTVSLVMWGCNLQPLTLG